MVNRMVTLSVAALATTAVTAVVDRRATEAVSQIMIPGAVFAPTLGTAALGAITAGMGVEALLPSSALAGGGRIAATAAVAIGAGILTGSLLGGRAAGLYGGSRS